jgi:hypothetical protein
VEFEQATQRLLEQIGVVELHSEFLMQDTHAPDAAQYFKVEY